MFESLLLKIRRKKKMNFNLHASRKFGFFFLYKKPRIIGYNKKDIKGCIYFLLKYFILDS